MNAPLAGNVRRDLLRLARRRRLVAVATAAARAAAPLLAALLLWCVLDQVLHLPEALRLLACLAVAAVAGDGLRRLWAALRDGAAPERMARLVEEATGTADNLVINGVQFEGVTPRSPEEAAFSGRTRRHAEALVATVPLAAVLGLRRAGLWLGLLVLAAAASGAYAWRWNDHARLGLRRLLLPLADLPALGDATLALEPGADRELDAGETLTVRVRVGGVDGRPAPAVAPVLLRGEGTAPLPERRDGAEVATMVAEPGQPGSWALTFPAVARSFTIRATCAGTWTRSVTLTVQPPPAVRAARWAVTPPPYIGTAAEDRPGPPATATVLPGASVALHVGLDRAVPALVWRLGARELPCTRDGDGWTAAATVDEAAEGLLVVPGEHERVIARAGVALDADREPRIELGGAERNRFAVPGERLALALEAGDDHGLSSLALTVHEAVDGAAVGELHRWRYLGPPGPPTASERFELVLDPARFLPGKAYVIEAVARDGLPPAGQAGRSAPVVVRIRALADLALPANDPGAAAFAALKETVIAEQRARGVTASLAANLPDVLAHRTLPAQARALGDAQARAREAGAKALELFAKAGDGATAATLGPIVEGEMGLVAGDLAALPTTAADALPRRIDAVATRQDAIIARLLALLGDLAERAHQREARAQAKASDGIAPPDAGRDALTSLADDLERFARDQERIIERSRTLAKDGPADLGGDEAAILGELAREEERWSKFLEEKLSDLSKMPPQDYADGRLADEFNEVFQEVKQAAAELKQKNIELAVPREQMGLEKAATLVQNLERWLPSTPDNLKWNMEDPQGAADIPNAELPAELEDIVGELLDQEEAMTEEVEDVTSSWMDSIDKGAGWGAGDGPISNMSAKGVTGNQLPNQQEVGGRSGEGRDGRSNGQMAESAAVGKQGRDTPTRLSATPFESGSVQDSDKRDPGGSTGGGKLAGFAAEGLQGPTPPPDVQQKLARLSGQQAQIRQQAGRLALQLRERRLPSGDVEGAVQAMAAVEDAAKRGSVTELRQRYSEAVDHLAGARRAVGDESRVRRERSGLPDRVREGLSGGATEALPAGYEELVGRYFQALAGETP